MTGYNEWLAGLAVLAGEPLILLDGDTEVASAPGEWSRSGSAAKVSATFESVGFSVTQVRTRSGATLEMFDEPLALPAGFVWDYEFTIVVGRS